MTLLRMFCQPRAHADKDFSSQGPFSVSQENIERGLPARVLVDEWMGGTLKVLGGHGQIKLHGMDPVPLRPSPWTKSRNGSL